jgi:hypothetical protein
MAWSDHNITDADKATILVSSLGQPLSSEVTENVPKLAEMLDTVSEYLEERKTNRTLSAEIANRTAIPNTERIPTDNSSLHSSGSNATTIFLLHSIRSVNGSEINFSYINSSNTGLASQSEPEPESAEDRSSTVKNASIVFGTQLQMMDRYEILRLHNELSAVTHERDELLQQIEDLKLMKTAQVAEAVTTLTQHRASFAVWCSWRLAVEKTNCN